MEHSAGGTDDIDNLIAICLTCHSDVHTRTQFTRRFTVAELKLHREGVYRLVTEGVLPSYNQHADHTAELSAEIVKRLHDARPAGPQFPLPYASMEILLAAVCERSPIHQYKHNTTSTIELRIGNQSFYFDPSKSGASPEGVPKPLSTLIDHGLSERHLDGSKSWTLA